MALRFKLDENIPARAVAALSTGGHDVHTVASEGLAGAHDRAVLEVCTAENRLRFTLDLDFADIREYPPGSHPGIWVLRPARQTASAVLALLEAGIRLSAAERTTGRVLDEQRVRIRD